MDSLVVAIAQYLPFLIPLAAGVAWLYLPSVEKIGLAVKAIVALVLAVLLVHLAATIHTDPRPFVTHPSVRPLFAHVADNGFPSDHTTLASTAALLVMTYRRWLGALLLVLSILAGAARVAAHVHHVQDIVGGVVIAALAVAVSTAAWAWVEPRVRARHTQQVSV